MTITKTTVKEYKIEPIKSFFDMAMKDFIEIRKKHGLTFQKFTKCFVCSGKFKDEDIPKMAHVEGEGNVFICDKCHDVLTEGVIDNG
jgi:uncharacterized CHY-type Zn-finger protein